MPIEPGKETFRATIQFMSSYAADFSPQSYNLWFRFADGDRLAADILSQYVVERRRMTPSEQETCYQKLARRSDGEQQDVVMARLGSGLKHVESSVTGTLRGAGELLDQLGQLGASLSDDEREQLADRLDNLKALCQELQYMLGSSASLVSGPLGDMPRFNFG